MEEGVACRCTNHAHAHCVNMAREWRELPGNFTSPRIGRASILRYVPLSSARATFRQAIRGGLHSEVKSTDTVTFTQNLVGRF